jgi:hypothetical protein
MDWGHSGQNDSSKGKTIKQVFDQQMVPFYHFCLSCGLYYNPMTIVNGNSRIVTKLETLLNDDARVVIYNCHRFIIQATGASSRIQTVDLRIRHLKCY